MSRIYVSLNVPGGAYGECVQEEPCLVNDPRYPPGPHTEDRLWVITRRTKPWGHFATARINGSVVVLDASLPTRVDRVPRGAKVVSREENARLWHDTSGSHQFG